MRRRLRRRLPDEGFFRTTRGIGYAALSLGGVMLVILPTFPILYTLMGWFLAFGGLLSALGSATGRWAGEYVGLPLLSSAMFSFAILTWRDNGWPMGGPSIMLLVAYGVFMFARWWDVRAIGRLAREMADGR